MIALTVLFACATMHPAPAMAEPVPVVVAQPEEPASAGSLWSDVQGRQILGVAANTRQIGDLVTVLVLEADSATSGASTNAARSSSSSFGIESMLGLETSIAAANPNLKNGISLGGSSNSATDGSGETKRNGSLTAVVTCQITEVLPGGNLRLYGTKSVRINNENQYLVLQGVVRQRDIRLDNTVQSNLLYGLQTEFSGQGVLSNQQTQPWATTVLNTISPF